MRNLGQSIYPVFRLIDIAYLPSREGAHFPQPYMRKFISPSISPHYILSIFWNCQCDYKLYLSNYEFGKVP